MNLPVEHKQRFINMKLRRYNDILRCQDTIYLKVDHTINAFGHVKQCCRTYNHYSTKVHFQDTLTGISGECTFTRIGSLSEVSCGDQDWLCVSLLGWGNFIRGQCLKEWSPAAAAAAAAAQGAANLCRYNLTWMSLNNRTYTTKSLSICCQADMLTKQRTCEVVCRPLCGASISLF